MQRQLTILGLLLLAPLAQAFTYQDEDVLLAFRKDGADDIVFNLGSISQFLNRSTGEEVNVTNWNLDLVKSKYDLNDEVKVVVLAVTSKDIKSPDVRRAWLSDAEPNTAVLDRTSSQWQLLWSKINSVGIKAQEFSQFSQTNVFTAPPTLPSTYTYIVSNGGSSTSTLPSLGGASAFKVESALPADVKFYEVKPSTVSPKPAAKLVGRFTLSTEGALKFIAGESVVAPPLDPVQITAIAPVANGIGVTFNSVAGAHYRLLSADTLGAPVGTWAAGSSTVVGTGAAVTLEDPAPGAAQRFYAVETFR